MDTIGPYAEVTDCQAFTKKLVEKLQNHFSAQYPYLPFLGQRKNPYDFSIGYLRVIDWCEGQFLRQEYLTPGEGGLVRRDTVPFTISSSAFAIYVEGVEPEKAGMGRGTTLLPQLFACFAFDLPRPGQPRSECREYMPRVTPKFFHREVRDFVRKRFNQEVIFLKAS
ncbi:hypothetical protein K8Q93_02995 [Candidatus Parcubacteria bacterium]|nr:hypothetical protein [Candidatus Parcubacteria bacterium]